MNRKQWSIAGIVIAGLLVLGIMLLRNDNADDSLDAGQRIPVSSLVYCSGGQIKPCVVSFSVDVDENMLVNIILPDSPFPDFYLKIIQSEVEINYKCQRVSATPNNAYCIGEKLPPGEVLHMMLISTRDDALLAEGNLSIIGLAYPTLEIAIPTTIPSITGTPSTLSPISTTPAPTQTQSPIIILPTSTKKPSSYPNPSYP